jgi:aminopeptidase N
VTVAITYDGVPHEAKKAPWDGGFVWAKTETGEPWIATAVQGDGCDLFWPCIDYPTGEPKLVDLHITVPAPLVAPANGVFKGMTEKDGWRTYNWQAKNPNTYAIALDVGPYEEADSDLQEPVRRQLPDVVLAPEEPHREGQGACSPSSRRCSTSTSR